MAARAHGDVLAILYETWSRVSLPPTKKYSIRRSGEGKMQEMLPILSPLNIQQEEGINCGCKIFCLEREQ